MSDSGNITLEVSVPSIGNTFPSNNNYYSRQEGLRDLTRSSKLISDEVVGISKRVEETASQVNDERLEQATDRLKKAATIKIDDSNPEEAGEAIQNIEMAKKLLAHVRKDNQRALRRIDLEKVIEYNAGLKELMTATETQSFESLIITARRAIDNNSYDFEGHLNDLRQRNFDVLWRQDWFVIDRFNWLEKDSYLFPDANEHAQLVDLGRIALREDDIQKLRVIVSEMDSIRLKTGSDEEMLASVNIVRV
jgi:molecular chaperone DnaK